jgi:choline-phosphate cytidylyltransferase
MKSKRVYIDGIFDLFHIGHLESFKKSRKFFDNTYLIVGVISDKDAKNYKRKPIIREKDRYEIIRNLRLVDLVIEDAPLIMTENFMKEYNIDLVVHGFANENDLEKQKEFFKIPIEMDKFKTIEYYKELSTTDIINKVKKM